MRDSDRRTAPRLDAFQSLARLLEALRRRSGATWVVADPSGCLVAGAGAAPRCEELAALAAGARHAPVLPLDTRWGPLLLAAESPGAPLLAEGGAGTARILGGARAAAR